MDKKSKKVVFDILSVFPGVFDGYFSESIIKRAGQKGKIAIKLHNVRDWTRDKHRTVDDTPYGGGPGMILKVEPIFEAIQEIVAGIKKTEKTRIILFSAKGKEYSQRDAVRLSQFDRLIFICGRYEGVDERVANYIADEEISIGKYILTGGEIPAMVLVDSITRLLPGVLGNADSLEEESFSVRVKDGDGKHFLTEYPQYTKPDDFQGWKVPAVLLNGDHKKIQQWRRGKANS